MARNIRVRAVKRGEVDEDKLALAFLMLAKALSDAEKKQEHKRPDGQSKEAA
jgi:hypothetical protein